MDVFQLINEENDSIRISQFYSLNWMDPGNGLATIDNIIIWYFNQIEGHTNV